MTAPHHAAHRAGLLRAAEPLAAEMAALAAILALAVSYRTLVEEQARGLLPMAA